MKTMMKEIEMIAYFTKEGLPMPLRYRIVDEEGLSHVVSVDQILWKKEDKRAGNLIVTYACQSVFHDRERRYELRFEPGRFRWYLHKM